MNLESFFAETAAAGWAPRDPCVDPRELGTLEQSGVRGDCIYPLLQAGDTIYVDRNAKPLPGDVVSFALSARGAAAQNSCLPTGQSAWAAGSHWCKLLGVAHGYQMLLDRHGSAATATLMASERPDDVPALYPVRQIQRNGRLLFGAPIGGGFQLTRRALLLSAAVAPLAACKDESTLFTMLPACEDASGAQIGANAATGTGSLAIAGPNTYNAGTLPGSPNYYGSYTGAAIDAASVVGATLTFDCVQTVSGSYAEAYMEANWGTGTQDSDICQINPVSVGQRYVIQKFFTGIPAATGWSIKIRLSCSSSASFTMSNTLMQVEVVKR